MLDDNIFFSIDHTHMLNHYEYNTQSLAISRSEGRDLIVIYNFITCNRARYYKNKAFGIKLRFTCDY